MKFPPINIKELGYLSEEKIEYACIDVARNLTYEECRVVSCHKQRGFELISKEQFKKDFEMEFASYSDLKLPKRATALSAGYDMFAPFNIVLKPGSEIVVPTGIKSYMLNDEVLFASPRSGHGFKFYIRLANTIGVIDADYFDNEDNEGHIKIKIRNEGSKLFTLKKGDAFCQVIFQKYLLADGDDFMGEDRKGGMGSTNQ